MADDQVGGNSAVATAEPAGAQAHAGQSAPASTETPSQNGQAATQAQSAPAEESFSPIDPETLSPELKSVYKSLQSDYTKKTQSIADARKKAEAYDKISQDQRFVDYWNGMNRQQKADFKEAKQEAEKRLGETISDEEFSKGLTDKNSFLDLLQKSAEFVSAKAQKRINELEQKVVISETHDFVDSFAMEKGPDGNLVRPDFDQLQEDNLITGFLSVNPPQEQTREAYRQRLNEAYTWAKSLSTKYYEKGRQEALKVVQKKAASSSEMPTNAAKNIYSGGDPKNLSVKELVELSRKGIRVPRND